MCRLQYARRRYLFLFFSRRITHAVQICECFRTHRWPRFPLHQSQSFSGTTTSKSLARLIISVLAFDANYLVHPTRISATRVPPHRGHLALATRLPRETPAFQQSLGYLFRRQKGGRRPALFDVAFPDSRRLHVGAKFVQIHHLREVPHHSSFMRE